MSWPDRALPDLDEPTAWFGGRLATGLVEVSHDASALDDGGWWVVVLTFEGHLTCARFEDVRRAPLPDAEWVAPQGSWHSSLTREEYVAAVEHVREEIARGEVYQVNVCRILSIPAPPRASAVGLARLLDSGNPSPYRGLVCLPSHNLAVVSASPELFLSRDDDVIESRPIKGTGRTAEDVSDKDRAENVMIVDLVRNDLGAVCRTGSVDVPELCVVEEHPGLVHLVSTVRGHVPPGVGWPEILGAAFPPGSVSGAPKSSALRIIADVEPTPRGPYCGALGWVDADRGQACLAVGIRTFWWDGLRLCFGTGAGITWSSDAQAEWAETELKASRLIGLASGHAVAPVGTTTRGERP